MSRKRPIKAKAKSNTVSNKKKAQRCNENSNKKPQSSKKFSISILRSRLNLKLLDSSDFSDVPQCTHGPCLLFSDADESVRWFSCAVFRLSKKCPFKVFVLPGDVIQDYVKVPKISSVPINEYGKIRRSFDSFSSDGTCCWCKHCINYVQLPHVHPVDEPCSSWISPTQLIRPLQRNQEEAQYWFTLESLNVISNSLTEDVIDSVLCIGTPTLFDFLQKASFNQPENGKRCFLLDFDDRLAHFYRADEFARYSMLNNHFYNADSRKELIKFFARARKVAVVCDPPFGVFIDALMKSLRSLKEMIRKPSETNVNTVLVLPIFVGKHVLKDPSFSMIDFKVTYENHKTYSKPESSIVRIFTDIRNNAFLLPLDQGYRFCKKCDRFVAQNNLHCLKCAKCPSKDGSKYIHCSACSRCVKSTYKHCSLCKTCHLPSRHIVV